MELADLFEVAFPGIKDVKDYENMDVSMFLGSPVSC
jgi:hypothetical protein